MSSVRIEGVVLKPNSHIRIALRQIFGIGPKIALDICNEVGIEPTVKVKDIDEKKIIEISEAVGRREVEGNLRRKLNAAIKHLKDIRCYRGLRHKQHLPCRGQNTRSNARTRKGPKGNVMKKSKKA